MSSQKKINISINTLTSLIKGDRDIAEEFLQWYLDLLLSRYDELGERQHEALQLACAPQVRLHVLQHVHDFLDSCAREAHVATELFLAHEVVHELIADGCDGSLVGA